MSAHHQDVILSDDPAQETPKSLFRLTIQPSAWFIQQPDTRTGQCQAPKRYELPLAARQPFPTFTDRKVQPLWTVVCDSLYS
tara:strand:- start:58 stop:303 length:246 start_codon:yes stop_codon:yes gene_type:complete